MEALSAHLKAQTQDFRHFFWHRLRFYAVSRYFPVGKDFSILDVGAGAGIFGDKLKERFPRASYYFIEPISFLEDSLECRFGKSQNFRRRASYGEMQFVISLDVLEHQADEIPFLEEIKQKMDPAAKLILTVPALPFLWSKWDELLGHHRRYTKQSLRRVLNQAGFKIEEIKYLFPELTLPGLWRKFRDGANTDSAAVDPSEAEFPRLPRWANDIAYGIGRCGLLLGNAAPFGSSLLVVASPSHPAQ